MVIWKFEIDLHELVEQVVDLKEIEMPNHAAIRFVGSQGNKICLWAEVVPSNPKTKRMFCIVGTGHPIPTMARYYIGSVQMPPFVWHIYETN